MSLKIAAESWPKPPLETAKSTDEAVVVREYDEERHKKAVEKMESLCEVGQRGKPSLVTDLMGDPICRIRHFPIHIMLVAEYGEEGEVVGVIRGCVKTVARGSSVYVKVAYLLGLRVSQTRRYHYHFHSFICCQFSFYYLFLHCTFHESVQWNPKET